MLTIKRNYLWLMFVMLVLSLTQIGCTDDASGDSGDHESTVDANLDAATDAEPDAPSNSDLDSGCTPGETSSDECDNQCVCTDAGAWQCTLRECTHDAGDTNDADGPDDASDPPDVDSPGDTDESNDGGDTSADAGCKAGDTKEVECNTCTCMNDGTWACTERECTYNPCEDKTCGEQCTVCPPDDPSCVETGVVKYCRPDGSCTGGPPTC
jgi:hypothetical protein